MPAKIGVLGGGQLGRMLQLAASPFLNTSLAFLDPNPNAPAKQVRSSSRHVDGSFQDPKTVAAFVEACDIVTYEIEHVATEGLSGTQKEQPSKKTLEIIKDKLRQKEHYQSHQLPTPRFHDVKTLETLKQYSEFPCVLKTRLGGYDGKGSAVIRNADEVEEKWDAINAEKHPCYMEEFIDFEHELACIVVKGRGGEIKSYDPVVTVQENCICRLVIAPAPIESELREKARELAQKAVGTFTGAGVYGVEMFLTPEGDVLLNEIAPRPHNSGHYTQNACHTSQFENHIRAILGLPLGSTALKSPYAAMLNILGGTEHRGVPMVLDDVDVDILDFDASDPTFWPVIRALSTEGTYIHMYGKDAPRPGRKLGHINVVAETYRELRERLDNLITMDYPMFNPKPLVGVIMGSDSDFSVMRGACNLLDELTVDFEVDIVSAHRTPEKMFEYARTAAARGLRVIIAGAGGAAHLPGMVASLTELPVIGVPVAGRHFDGADSLHSIVQMPRGVPVATVAVNNAINAAILATRIISTSPDQSTLRQKLLEYHRHMEQQVHRKSIQLRCDGWEKYPREYSV